MTYIAIRAPFNAAANRMAAVTVFASQENAAKTLETGATTVRHLRAAEYSDIAMSELINRGRNARRRCGLRCDGRSPDERTLLRCTARLAAM
jgi:hypothetical protein